MPLRQCNGNASPQSVQALTAISVGKAQRDLDMMRVRWDIDLHCQFVS